MTRQLLRDTTAVIEYAGQRYQMKAMSSFSAETSLTELTQRRKTLFANTPKQASITSRINSTSISLSVIMTQEFVEKVFFHLAGMNISAGGMIVPNLVSPDTRMCSIYLYNTGSVAYAENCFVQSLDLTFSKDSPLTLSVTLSAGSIKMLEEEPVLSIGAVQGAPLPVTPVNLLLGSELINHITSASYSIQQIAEWRDNKTLFNLGDTHLYEDSRAFTSDLLFSSTLELTYRTDCSLENRVTNQNVDVSKSGLRILMENARVIHNLNIQTIYQSRLDVSLSERSGDTIIFFGD